MCPPASQPSATTASAPSRSTRLAMATEGTTGTTLMPVEIHSFIYAPGSPAPVVTMGTFSSSTTFATSAACGLISMMLTPNGLSVNSRILRISPRRYSPSALMAEINPSPPAFETAAARVCSLTQAMPP